ncbi:hypothetical protein GGF38_002869, partial [Coemansia sp. RSA 25]
RRNAGMPAEDDDTATKSSDASRHNKATPAHPHSQSVSPIGPKPAVRAAQAIAAARAKPKPTTAAVAQAGASVVKGAVRQRIAALESTKSHNSLVPPPAVSNNRRPIAQPASVSSRLAAATQTHAAKANGIAKAPASDMPWISSCINSIWDSFIISSDAADDASSLTPTHAVAVPGFHSPLLKRVRPASSAAAADSSDESSSASTPSTKRVAKPMGQRPSRWARRVVADAGRGAAESSESAAGTSNIASQRSSDDAPSSPFKSILTPVLDLFRRVSGIAQDPLGLQQRPDSASSNASEAPSARASSSVAEASRSSAHPLSSDSADVFACAMPGALDSATTCAPPPGSIEANSLTAPPMNPTTIGGAAGPPSYLANCVGATGSCMQLYLPESAEIGGSVDSCSASPVTAGYPETPSKENIPMYGEYDFDAANDEITAMSAVALAGIPPAVSLLRAPEMAAAAAAAQQESDLDLSQISSLADSDIDAQYEQYLQYEEDEDEFNPYLFMADLPPIPKEHTLRPYALPRKTRSSPPITLVLDLDETLVHCALTAVENADLVFPVEYNGLNYDVYCRLRPGYREFLEKASELFEVVVFTASQQVYADRLLNLIDPERRYIRHRLFRDSCVY